MPRRRAFTLIELLVVIAIISLLISIVAPSLSAARRNSERTTCAAHLREVGLALRSYLDSNEERLPSVSYMPSTSSFPLPSNQPPVYVAKVLRPDSVGQDQIFKCPSDKGGVDRGSPNRFKSYFDTELSSYNFRWRAGGQKLEDYVKDFEKWTGTNVPITSVWIFQDYNNFHDPNFYNAASQDPNTPVRPAKGARRYLYIDGHVTGYELY